MRNIVFVLLILFIASCSAKAPPRQTTTEISSEEQKKAALEEERRKKRQEEARKKEEEELRKLIADVQPIIANILQAVDTTDHERFIRDFDDSFRETNKSKKRFIRGNKRRKERLGDVVRSEFWKVEKRNPYYTLFYKVKFTKVEEPVEIRLIVAQEKDKEGKPTGDIKVSLMQFISPALQDR